MQEIEITAESWNLCNKGKIFALIANQMWALNGAIDGTIFLWLCDTHVLLLLNLSQLFLHILLKSNHMRCTKLHKQMVVYSKLHSKSWDYLH